MRFPDDFIQKVRDANDIVEIIGQYTQLKPSGSRLVGRCPFPDHSDKSPSFSVTEHNQLFYCFGCHKGGTVYTFLEKYNGMAFPEAVEYLARRASIPLPEPEPGAKQFRSNTSRDEKDGLLRVNKLAAIYYYKQLKGLADDHPARAYLVKRGLSEEIVDIFRIGYANEEWQDLDRYLAHEKNVPRVIPEKLVLIKQRKNGVPSRPDDMYRDFFRDRLIFPIFSQTSDVIGFGGRTLGDDLPKYLNSQDSPVFHKSKVLYGIHETGKHIRAQDQAVVVEGYMDAIALYAAGIKNVVAILGTAFTPDHAKVLKRHSTNVTMLLDGDAAGFNAAAKSLPILLEAGLMPKGLLLPEKMDPDDFVKAFGADKLRNEIERAPELFTLLLQRSWMANYRGRDSEKVQIIEEAAYVMKGMPNVALRDLYILEMSRQLDVDLTWLRGSLQRAAEAMTVREATLAAQNKKPEVAAAAPTPVAAPSKPPAGAGPSRQQSAGGPGSAAGRPTPVATAGSARAQAPAPSNQYHDSPPPDLWADGGYSNSGLQSGYSAPYEPGSDAAYAAEVDAMGDGGHEAPQANQKISLKMAPRDEAFVLSLLVQSEDLLTEFIDADPASFVQIFIHEGVREALLLAERLYVADPGNFATLASKIVERVDNPSMVTSAISLVPNLGQPSGADRARKIMADYMRSIRQKFYRRQARVLTAEINQANPENLESKLEELRDLHRSMTENNDKEI